MRHQSYRLMCRCWYASHAPEIVSSSADVGYQVFTHGLGGSASQFAPLLTSLVNVAPTLAIDLPGCGLSDFRPSSTTAALSTHALAELVVAVVSRFRDAGNDQKVVLIGHSMGCSINALLASSTSPLSHSLEGHIAGVIAICPTGGDRTPDQERGFRRISKIPPFLFDLFRIWDRRGGIYSPGVSRMVGQGTDDETRKLQVRFNEQSQTQVFLSILASGIGSEGMPGKDVWSGIKVPLFLVGAEADTVTPAHEVEKIAEYLSSAKPPPADNTRTDASMLPMPGTAGDAFNAEELRLKEREPLRTASGSIIKDDQTSSKHASALKTTVFPPPTGHALPYTGGVVRILAGMIENFLDRHVDHRLGRGWQLQQLQTSGKWDVKNLKKWESVQPCSAPIGGVFRAMKTMREVDDHHRPSEFVKHFGADVLDDGVVMVIDISNESPVYNPSALEECGVEYHKFPTVSKQVPRAEEAEQFIALIDRFRRTPKLQPRSNGKTPTIAVHCHYGYNRTGFFIVCYMVERLGYKLEDAIYEFGEKRPPRGIKHEYFIDELYVRYAVKGIARRGTVVRTDE